MSLPASSNAPGVASTEQRSPRKREALELFSGLPRRYDELSAALSFWQDPRWRRALVSAAAPRAGQRVLDVATGTGMVAAELLARADCTVVGIDQSPQMLAAARARFAADGGHGAGASARVELIEGQAESLPFAEASFDALTFTYLLRYVDDPAATMRELARVVRPAAVWRRSSSACRRGPPRVQRGVCTRPSACRRWGAWPRASGRRSGRFLGPEHPRLLRAPSAGGARRLLAAGGSRARAACGA